MLFRSSYRTIRGELESYGHGLGEKPEVVVLNKADAITPAARTRKMAALAHAMDIDALDKSTVSQIFQDRDAQVAAFRARPFHDAMPYVCIDAS